MPNWAMFPRGMKTLMARNLQGFLWLPLSSEGQCCYSGNKGWCVWGGEFRTACVFACVLRASCGDMWKEKNSHGSFTPCDTSNSHRVQAGQAMHSADVGIMFVFFFMHLLKNDSLLSLLPVCLIIYRHSKSGLAQQGAYQLTTCSYRAVKMQRSY